MTVGGQESHSLFRFAATLQKESGEWRFVSGMAAVATVGQSDNVFDFSASYSGVSGLLYEVESLNMTLSAAGIDPGNQCWLPGGVSREGRDA